MDEFSVGSYVYFGGNEKSFKVLKNLGDGRLELVIKQTRNGRTTRIVDIVGDEVTTTRTHAFGLDTVGLPAGVRRGQARL